MIQQVEFDNSAARLVFAASKFDHGTFLLLQIHCVAEGNYGLFAPKTIRSRERKFQVWNFRTLGLSVLGTFGPTNECTKER